MEYLTHEPHPDLRAFIKCHWSLDAPPEEMPLPQRILPDGCMEMIFHCADLYLQCREDGSKFVQPRCFVFGQITTTLDIIPTGATSIFSVRFLPHGFTPLATIPLSQMENRAVPLEELFGADGLALEKEILDAPSHAARVPIVEAFLLKQLTLQQSIDNLAQSSVDLILSLNGQLSIDALSEQVNAHRRQLERRFASAIGLSPKQLSKVVRLQATLRHIASQQAPSLTTAALEGNYYDQAHFIKDFKEFTGQSPKNFFADNLKMSALFIGTE